MSDITKKNEPKEVLWKDRKHHLWFPFSFTKYWIQNSRLHSSQGFFKTVTDEALLYKVMDVTMTRTFAQKIFGTGTITVTMRMDRDGTIKLENIKHPKEVKEFLSRVVEEDRTKRNVVGKEFFGADIQHYDVFDTNEAGADGTPHI